MCKLHWQNAAVLSAKADATIYAHRISLNRVIGIVGRSYHHSIQHVYVCFLNNNNIHILEIRVPFDYSLHPITDSENTHAVLNIDLDAQEDIDFRRRAIAHHALMMPSYHQVCVCDID